jgi:hypothetical protein
MKKFIRDNKGILINNDSNAYAARRAAKMRARKEKTQEEEIESLKAQIAELKSMITSLNT